MNIDTGTTNVLYTFNISREEHMLQLLLLADGGTMVIEKDNYTLTITKEPKPICSVQIPALCTIY